MSHVSGAGRSIRSYSEAMVAQLSAADALAAGRAALVRGNWREAGARFTDSLAVEESPAAYEGLGVALRYLWDIDAARAAHERGYRLARSAGDADAAAKLAGQLAVDAATLGRTSEANGWAERALMITELSGPTEGRAFALVLLAHLTLGRDPAETIALARQAVATARAVDATDVELMALALEGLALVSTGAVAQGMRELDAATAAAVAGEVSDVDMAESICCYLIDACKRVRDLVRAAEWCERVAEISRRFDDRFMFAVCRVHHADVLLWSGDWTAADEQLGTAARLFGELGGRQVRDCLVRQAELRRRQGRLDEAAELLEQCTDHRLHALHAGLLALARDDAQEAVGCAHRFLRRAAGSGDRFERVAGLELLVQAAVRQGRRDEAAEAAGEIRTIADAVGTVPLAASALLAEARVAAANGEHRSAWSRFEDAAAAYAGAGADYEAALATSELAASLRAGGDAAASDAAAARARTALAGLGVEAPAPDGAGGVLSQREREVLALLALGRSNEEIAAELVLSVRTVERHVANTYRKLRLSGRTARAAAASWAYAHGIG